MLRGPGPKPTERPGHAHPEGGGEPAGREAGSERNRVLIASGAPEWTARVHAALTGSPVDLMTAEAGAAVLERLDRDANGITLIVLDALLEDMSGLALCRRLRESEAGRSVLVLLVSRWSD